MARLGVIPSLPGAHTPTFLTSDQRLLSLDRVIFDVVEHLEEDGMPLSPYVAKCVVQCARHRLARDLDGDLQELAECVRSDLRKHRVLLTAVHVDRVLQAYGMLVASLGIVATH